MATVAPEVPVPARDEAFEQLYHRYVKDVYHYSLALLRNPADAEDVTQTTFLNAYRAYKRGEQIRKPHNWLIKIAHNVARSRHAHVTRRVKEVPLDEHLDQLALPDDEPPNVEGVLRALGRLPFNQRAALVMRELEGRTYTEIADTLGVSVSAVETLIFRARRSLRVQTAALRSILTVPVPSSLAELFGGGGTGAAAGAGAAGLLIKTALALVVGGLATGIAVENGKRAAAAPQHAATPPAAAHSTDVRSHTVAKIQRARHAARNVSPRRRAPRSGLSPGPSVQAAAPAAATPAAAVPASTPTSAPAPSSRTVLTVVENTVQSAVGTVDQVTAVLPVSVVPVPPLPPLPVQAPPLPKLP